MKRGNIKTMKQEKINHPYLTAIKRTEMSVPTRYLLQHNFIKGKILDFGCGSGRDSKYFIDNHGIEIANKTLDRIRLSLFS